VSPIFVRPVREQLEHDRLIRHLALKYKRKFEVATNVGDEQLAPLKIGTNTFFPDLVLTDGKKLAGVVEVESAESVNNLEAMAQWVPFSRSRVPFHLYVPVQTYDVARRFCEGHKANVTEIWTYRPMSEEFDLVRMFHDAAAPMRTAGRRPAPPPKADKPVKADQPIKTEKAEPDKPEKAERTEKALAKDAKPVARPSAKPTPAKAAPAKPVAAKAAAAKPVSAKPVRSSAKAAKPKPAAKPAAKATKAAAKPAAARRPARAGKAASGRKR
jgi:hypothetical protein